MPNQLPRGWKMTKIKSKKFHNWFSCLLIVVGLWFAWLNIHPYEKLVSLLTGQNISNIFSGVVASIPIVNGLVAVAGLSLSWLLGAVLWFIIQVIEVLPLLLYSEERFLSNVVSSSQYRHKYEIDETDERGLKIVKKAYNALPTSIVSKLETLKVFTYTADFLICLTVYSPVESGKFTDFFFALTTGQFQELDYLNIVKAVITLFAIEVVVSLVIWSRQLSYFMGHREA